MPLEAVGPLTTIGGFVLAKTGGNVISAGVLTLHHDDAAGVPMRVANFSAIRTGTCSVPAEAASELLAHGFVPVFEETMLAWVERIVAEQSFEKGLISDLRGSDDARRR